MTALLRQIIPLIPTLLKKKRSWGALAVAAMGFAVSTGVIGSDLDRFWKAPRDVLVDRVEDARDAQQDAAEEFQDALTEFKAVVDLEESELERQYKRLNKAFERSEAAAGAINSRVDRVVAASNRLLDEWKDELKQYNDANLKQLAEGQFDQTRDQATRMIEAMRRSEQRIQPVLDTFRDQVLYLKHNLNLSAIASLEGEAAVIEINVDALIEDMNRSIAEADAFLGAMLANSG
ncbi:MAG: DUF2959 family protein [Gammaproteobacteria bacterium]